MAGVPVQAAQAVGQTAPRQSAATKATFATTKTHGHDIADPSVCTLRAARTECQKGWPHLLRPGRWTVNKATWVGNAKLILFKKVLPRTIKPFRLRLQANTTITTVWRWPYFTSTNCAPCPLQLHSARTPAPSPKHRALLLILFFPLGVSLVLVLLLVLKPTFPDRFGWVDLGSLLTFSSHMSLSVCIWLSRD